MEEETKVENEVVPTATPEPSQEKDPVQAELERVEAKPKKSKLEKLEYTKQRVEQQLAEERARAGIQEDEDRPLTVREFKQLQQQEAQETAMKLAESIDNEAERKLTQYHLENTIRPSGDAQTDLRNARLLVNAVKNTQIAEETVRSVKARTTASGAGAPPKEKQTTELTKEERDYMTAFKLTPEEVIAARPQE